jgi:hypothetical protein
VAMPSASARRRMAVSPATIDKQVALGGNPRERDPNEAPGLLLAVGLRSPRLAAGLVEQSGDQIRERWGRWTMPSTRGGPRQRWRGVFDRGRRRVGGGWLGYNEETDPDHRYASLDIVLAPGYQDRRLGPPRCGSPRDGSSGSVGIIA